MKKQNQNHVLSLVKIFIDADKTPGSDYETLGAMAREYLLNLSNSWPSSSPGKESGQLSGTAIEGLVEKAEPMILAIVDDELAIEEFESLKMWSKVPGEDDGNLFKMSVDKRNDRHAAFIPLNHLKGKKFVRRISKSVVVGGESVEVICIVPQSIDGTDFQITTA